jgi:hypothetical protein
VQDGQKAKPPLCWDFAEPSDGLEPSTPSLPWRIHAAGGGLRTALATAFFLQLPRFVCKTHPFLQEPRVSLRNLEPVPRTQPPKKARSSRWDPGRRMADGRFKGGVHLAVTKAEYREGSSGTEGFPGKRSCDQARENESVSLSANSSHWQSSWSLLVASLIFVSVPVAHHDSCLCASHERRRVAVSGHLLRLWQPGARQ